LGPVLLDTEARRPLVASSPTRQRDLRMPVRLAGLAAVLALAVAVASALGFVAARSAGTNRSHVTRADARDPAAPGYTVAFNRALISLRAASAGAGLRLAQARTAGAQANAASQLAAVNRTAAATLRRLDAGPAVDANLAVASGLSALGDAYAALAGAAEAHRPARYAAARSTLAVDRIQLETALNRLQALGYGTAAGPR
jgi:hypothetical protein